MVEGIFQHPAKRRPSSGKMRLIIIGCEYAGKTTTALAIARWLVEAEGSSEVRIHDHWVFPYLTDQDPSTCYLVGAKGRIPEEGRYRELGSSGDLRELSSERAKAIQALSPWLLEQLQRAMVWRHLHPLGRESMDKFQIGFYYAEAVYAPLYYGYGEPGSFADRTRRAREWDGVLMETAPETALVHVKATPQVITRRMTQEPRPGGFIKEQDVAGILLRFEEEYASSLIDRKIALDTSDSSVDEVLKEFRTPVSAIFDLSGRSVCSNSHRRSVSDVVECLASKEDDSSE